jgi:uncharacterized Zn finger protein
MTRREPRCPECGSRDVKDRGYDAGSHEHLCECLACGAMHDWTDFR